MGSAAKTLGTKVTGVAKREGEDGVARKVVSDSGTTFTMDMSSTAPYFVNHFAVPVASIVNRLEGTSDSDRSRLPIGPSVHKSHCVRYVLVAGLYTAPQSAT